MKHLTLLFLSFFVLQCALGQTKPIETLPNVNFDNILNAPVKNISLSQLKGKIVLIEFWATWCSPCIDVMPYLSKLQAKYRNKLRVITVTDERTTRIRQFLNSKPSNLWFAIDTARSIAKIFPYTTIPHTVIISGDGKLIATTAPELISESVIDSIVHKKEVHLADQRGILMESSDIIKKYFFAKDTVKNRFVMQAGLKGSNSFSKTYPLDSIFKGRRITCVNLKLTGLYMAAYPDFPYSRVKDITGEKKDAPLYCLDLIVQNKKDLLPAMRKELSTRFDLQPKIEQESKEVNVLKIIDSAKFKCIPVNQSGKRTFTAKHGEINEQYITMADLAGYLENYGVEKLPVIDETLNKEHFDIKFSFQPEKPESLTLVLQNMGLVLEHATRKVVFLILYKPQN